MPSVADTTAPSNLFNKAEDKTRVQCGFAEFETPFRFMLDSWDEPGPRTLSLEFMRYRKHCNERTKSLSVPPSDCGGVCSDIG